MTKKTIIGDKMIEAQLKEKSDRLNISIYELIDRYIRRGLFTDDYYEPPQLTREELLEISRKELQKDIKNGIPPRKHNFDIFVNRWSKNDY